MATPAFQNMPTPKAESETESRVNRHRPLPLHDLFPQQVSSSPLLWGIDSALLAEETWQRVLDLDAWVRREARIGNDASRQRKGRKSRQVIAEDWEEKLSDWLGLVEPWLAFEPDQREGSFLITALAWCHALPVVQAIRPSEVADRLHTGLQRMVREPIEKVAASNPWTYHLVGELGLTLAYLFPGHPVDAGWEEPSREALTHGICELTDGEGQVHVHHLKWSMPLLATWTRSQFLARAMERVNTCFLQEGEDQYRWFVQQVLRWTRRDGRPMELMGGLREATTGQELWRAVLSIQEDSATRFLAATILPKRWNLTTRGDLQLKDSAAPSLSMVAEWAEVALLRESWHRRAPQLAVTFAGRELRTELSSGKRILWSGDSLPQVRINGKPLTIQGEADLTCTFSDEDAEYIEVEFACENEWRLQRQILLGRKDQILLFADALLGPENATIEYANTLPITKETEYRPESETNEGWLFQDERPLALVLPLALPEWRADRNVGHLSAEPNGVTLCQQAEAATLFAPLFLDLAPKRQPRPHTWRQLTVAERLQIQSPDVAIGYRVQIGKTQWLIYRSLQQSGMRTVLGQHFSQEFVMGRFKTDGQLEQILQIS